MTPRRRRILAAAGMLVPAAALATVSVYVVVGGGGSCGASSAQGNSGCAGDAAGVALVTFPAAILCMVFAAALLRGARWVRWPAVMLGAVLATVTAAGTLAGVVALASGDNADVRGAVVLGVVGVAVTAACALPPILLPGRGGAAAFGEEDAAAG